MKHSERFNRAISALVQAYFNGTLVKANCTACAVGNIIAKSMDAMIYTNKKGVIFCEKRIENWSDIFSTWNGVQELRPDRYNGYAKELIDSTGYSWEELARVELAFENNTNVFQTSYNLNNYSTKAREDQYRGLMAVVDVLCDIEGIDTAETKKLFNTNCEIHA